MRPNWDLARGTDAIPPKDRQSSRRAFVRKADQLAEWGQQVGGDRDYVRRIALLGAVRFDQESTQIRNYIANGVLPSLRKALHGLSPSEITRRRRADRAVDSLDLDSINDQITLRSLGRLFR